MNSLIGAIEILFLIYRGDESLVVGHLARFCNAIYVDVEELLNHPLIFDKPLRESNLVQFRDRDDISVTEVEEYFKCSCYNCTVRIPISKIEGYFDHCTVEEDVFL